MSKTLSHTKSSPLRVGSSVSLMLGARRVHGEVVEDRGPLAADGKHLYRVRIAVSPDESLSFEMPEDEISSEE